MVISQIAILNKTASPAPNDVQMLRLIDGKLVVRDGDGPQKDQPNEKQGRRNEFVRVGQTEIIGYAPC